IQPHEMRATRSVLAGVGPSGRLLSRETMGATLAAVEGHPGAVVAYGWQVLYSRDNPEKTAQRTLTGDKHADDDGLRPPVPLGPTGRRGSPSGGTARASL